MDYSYKEIFKDLDDKSFEYFAFKRYKQYICIYHRERGYASFDTNTGLCYLGHTHKDSLVHYFRGYGLSINGYFDNRKTMRSDFYKFKDTYKEFLLSVRKQEAEYMWHNSKIQNIGTLFSRSRSYLNQKRFIDIGIYCNFKPEIKPTQISKDVLRILREKRVTFDKNMQRFFLEDKKLYEDFMRLVVLEKIYEPENMYDNESKFYTRLMASQSYITDLLKRYNYNLKALLRYVHNYIIPYENYTISHVYRDLHDYAYMYNSMKITDFNKYPKYLKSNHDIVTKEHDLYKKEISEKEFTEKVDLSLEHKTRKFNYIVPKTSDDIKKEGICLSHCVGSYINRVINGTSKIIFMRKKEDESFITLELKENCIIQAKGEKNRELIKDEIIDLKNYAKAKRFEVRI